MQDINIDEAHWASSMLTEGIVERLCIADGAIVAAGDQKIRIEDALHEITVPASGRLTIVAAEWPGTRCNQADDGDRCPFLRA